MNPSRLFILRPVATSLLMVAILLAGAVAYYQLPVSMFKLTLDYQFVVNPGYNTDRGPASVVAARLHSQF